MAENNPFPLNDLSRDAWLKEIDILKRELTGLGTGRVILEYTSPRRGKRIDAVVLTGGIVFLLEFKVGSDTHTNTAREQVLDYALDLKNFHKESENRIIVPIAIATEAAPKEYALKQYDDRVLHPISINAAQIGTCIKAIASDFDAEPMDCLAWENSVYMPTPTIIEAAQALYADHNVKDITRNDAADLSSTTTEIKRIIAESKAKGEKSIIFVTGVPGAGKTLVGLNLASELHNNAKGEHAVFLSGNAPLVSVLQEALARDKVARERELGNKCKKVDAMREVTGFIQIVYKYRDYHFGNDNPPAERIAVFDESQRAWTQLEMSNFLKKNNKAGGAKAERDLSYSEPGFLISTMDRLKDWAVIVCLVGGGQEINRGEAGMPEWFDSLRAHFPYWNVYATKQINDDEYLRGRDWEELTDGLKIHLSDSLHLSASMRSFRSEKVADFVKHLLDNNDEAAREAFRAIRDKYPVKITRNLETAKSWVKSVSRGSERYGLFASSNAARLKPRGVVYAKDRNSISPANWFLNDKDDIRSSYFLEAVASEFETQGLELDYAVVAWDADFRIENGRWNHYRISTRLSPPNWSRIQKEEDIIYLTNAYRVLLTRARQGFVIYIPEGVDDDATRCPKIYDETYNYLKSVGISEI
ncbi:MAG: DUF2075 domain-containing protein [Abditibacteriota bacterium]|nr:DUF2075 domain-containing protein [Abditibacteriota bacterium]